MNQGSETNTSTSTFSKGGDYAEKLTLVARAFESHLDLESALVIVPLSDEERSRLRKDPDLLAFVEVARAKAFEEIIDGIKEIARDKEERAGVRLAALKEMGRVMRPDKFKETVAVEGDVVWRVVPRQKKGAESADKDG